MEWIKAELDQVVRKRIKQLTTKLDQLDAAGGATGFQLLQDTCWKMEQFMRDLRQVEHRLVESWQIAHGNGCATQGGLSLPACTIAWKGEVLSIRFEAILPFKTRSRCDLQCEELRDSIQQFVAQEGLAAPVFQKAVVVFLHHRSRETVRIRDYDNLERKGVLDALVPIMIPDDSPRHIRTCDFLVEDQSDFTEILVMSWPSFLNVMYLKEFAF